MQAADSVWARTKPIPRPAAASMRSRLAPPGTPNSRCTPAWRRPSATAAAKGDGPAISPPQLPTVDESPNRTAVVRRPEASTARARGRTVSAELSALRPTPAEGAGNDGVHRGEVQGRGRRHAGGAVHDRGPGKRGQPG